MRLTVLILTIFLAVPAHGADAADGSAEHDALRTLRQDLVTALNANDVQALEGVLTKDFQLHFADQTLITDLAALPTYAQRFKDSYNITTWNFAPDADGETRLPQPGVGIVAGRSTDTYTVADGRSVVLQSRWTATVVKQADGWRVASAHVSLDPFDNPIIDLITAGLRGLLWVVGIGGLLVGLLGGWLLGRRRRAAAP